MDGTILNSIAAAERIWAAWAARQGLDVQAFLPTIHGARAIDTIARLGLPGIDPGTEADAITIAEIADVEGIVELPGAARFLASLPTHRWAVVTSAPRALALRRMQAAGVPVPDVLVSADDVAEGKPNPACYVLAARQLGVDVADCLVFEDAPVGLRAGEAAGASLMLVTSTHRHPVVSPYRSIRDYQNIACKVDESGLLFLEQTGD